MTPELAEYYRGLAAYQDWLAIVPEIMLGVLALLLLVAELVLAPGRKHLLPAFAIAPQLVMLALVGMSAVTFDTSVGSLSFFSGTLVQTQGTEIMRVFFLAASILVCHLGSVVFPKQKLPQAEFLVLVLIATASVMILAQARHFVLLFVALEALAISLYVLVAYIRTSAVTLEAGLKYLIMSGLSSALILFGIVLLYGAGGNPLLQGSSGDPLSFVNLRAFIALNPDNAYVITGSVLVICGLFFKIAAVPFQIWVSDVYQGAPTPVTAFLAVASKGAGFVLLINILGEPFISLQGYMLPLLQAVAIVTILFGNLAALGQRNVKRLMGLSGIAHAGYILLGICAAYHNPWYVNAVYFYLFMYLLASFGVFLVMAHVSDEDDSVQEVEHYAQLLRRNPLLGGVLAISLGSLAGIPPLAGFSAKLLLFVAAYSAGLYWALGAAILGVILSIYYYFNWMRESAFIPSLATDTTDTTPDTPLTLPTFWSRTIATLLAMLTVAFGFWQGIL